MGVCELGNLIKKKSNKRKIDKKSLCYLIYIGAVILAMMYNPLFSLVLVGIGIIILIIINRADLMTVMGIGQYNKKNKEKAFRLLNKAHMSSAGKMKNTYNYAYLLLREGRIDEAKTAIKYGLLRPNITENEICQGKEILSMIYYRQGSYDKATKVMQYVFDHSINSNVYGALGYYKILAKSSDAEEFNLQAYDYNNKDKVIIDNLVQLYYDKGDYKTAEKYSKEALSLSANGIETFYHAGLVQKALGNKDEAVENFKKALSFEPSFLTTVTREEIERQIESIENE